MNPYIHSDGSMVNVKNVSPWGMVGRLISGIRVLGIPRAEDLPYYTSPPIQFVYESTANLNAGAYTWNDTPTALTPNRPLVVNSMYFFRNISLTADIAEFDFTSNILTTPEFRSYRVSDQLTMMYREPVLMTKFFDQFDYRLWWTTQREADSIRAAFSGILQQGAGLLGKNAITLKAIISAQEVTDQNYVEAFKRAYPAPKENT